MDDIHGLKPFLFFSPNWKLIALVVLAALAAFAVAVWARRRRPAMAPVPAEQRAPVAPRSVREQLAALEAEGLAAAGRYLEFHARLSALMRAYLGARYGMPARRFTTTELLAALHRAQVEPEVQRVAASLLLESDLVKFAEARPTAQDAAARLEEARALIAQLGDLETVSEDDMEPLSPGAIAPVAEGPIDVLG